MISFGREPYAEMVRPMEQEEEEEDEQKVAEQQQQDMDMDEEPIEEKEVERDLFTFPTPILANPPLERPEALDPLFLGGINAFFTIPGTVETLERAFCAMPCLPLVVRRSPILDLLVQEEHVPGEAVPWKVSMYHLRAIMTGITDGFIPVLASAHEVSFHGRTFHVQMELYEKKHAITADMDMDTVTRTLHAFSYFALHCIERFIHCTLLLPHMPLLQLEHVLTPVEWLPLDACPKRDAALASIAGFFELKRMLMVYKRPELTLPSIDFTRRVYVDDAQLLHEYRNLLLAYNQ